MNPLSPGSGSETGGFEGPPPSAPTPSVDTATPSPDGNQAVPQAEPVSPADVNQLFGAVPGGPNVTVTSAETSVVSADAQLAATEEGAQPNQAGQETYYFTPQMAQEQAAAIAANPETFSPEQIDVAYHQLLFGRDPSELSDVEQAIYNNFMDKTGYDPNAPEVQERWERVDQLTAGAEADWNPEMGSWMVSPEAELTTIMNFAETLEVEPEIATIVIDTQIKSLSPEQQATVLAVLTKTNQDMRQIEQLGEGAELEVLDDGTVDIEAPDLGNLKIFSWKFLGFMMLDMAFFKGKYLTQTFVSKFVKSAEDDLLEYFGVETKSDTLSSQVNRKIAARLDVEDIQEIAKDAKPAEIVKLLALFPTRDRQALLKGDSFGLGFGKQLDQKRLDMVIKPLLVQNGENLEINKDFENDLDRLELLNIVQAYIANNPGS